MSYDITPESIEKGKRPMDLDIPKLRKWMNEAKAPTRRADLEAKVAVLTHFNSETLEHIVNTALEADRLMISLIQVLIAETEVEAPSVSTYFSAIHALLRMLVGNSKDTEVLVRYSGAFKAAQDEVGMKYLNLTLGNALSDLFNDKKDKR